MSKKNRRHRSSVSETYQSDGWVQHKLVHTPVYYPGDLSRFDEDYIATFPVQGTTRSFGMYDIVGNYGAIDNEMELTRTNMKMPSLAYKLEGSAFCYSGSYRWNINFFISASGLYVPGVDDLFGSTYSSPSFFNPPSESENDYVVRMASRLNPSRAAVDIGVNIAELAGLPKALFRAAKHLSKGGSAFDLSALTGGGNVGSQYLEYQYGIKPLWNDIQKFLKLTDAVEKRINYIRRLKKQGRLRASSKKFPTVYRSQFRTNIHDAFGGLWEVSGIQTITRWCTIYYTPTADDLPESSESDRAAAFKAAYGLKPDGTTLWNAMPWSWALDWVGNYGDFINAHRNSIGAKMDKVLLMETTETIVTVKNVLAPEPREILANELRSVPVDLEGAGFDVGGLVFPHVRGKPGHSHTVRKTRKVVEPFADSNISLGPILGSEFRTSIVGALLAQRRLDRLVLQLA